MVFAGFPWGKGLLSIGAANWLNPIWEIWHAVTCDFELLLEPAPQFSSSLRRHVTRLALRTHMTYLKPRAVGQNRPSS